MKRKEYAGKDITVTFDMKRCIHARNCFLKLPQVFDPAQRPWVQPDNAPAEEIAAMVRTCPSGALAFRKENADEMVPPINRITVLENGPLAIAGDITVEDGESETRVTLCRCGLSKNKPFCDYSHVEGGFEATGEPKAKTSPMIDERGNAVRAFRIPDGPLKVEGNVELTTGTGLKIGTHEKAFLCRCGASKNKPYCDGSHKDAGFSDPA
jgi:CDGSH-type Zn-finger protein/uncharacterized Fe-S cluster protein YjdI